MAAGGWATWNARPCRRALSGQRSGVKAEYLQMCPTPVPMAASGGDMPCWAGRGQWAGYPGSARTEHVPCAFPALGGNLSLCNGQGRSAWDMPSVGHGPCQEELPALGVDTAHSGVQALPSTSNCSSHWGVIAPARTAWACLGRGQLASPLLVGCRLGLAAAWVQGMWV